MAVTGLISRIRRTIERYQMLPVGSRVLVAVSGGADSVAMLHLLSELTMKLSFSIAGVAHFNHQLRLGDADEDERFCASLAASLGLSFEAGRGDIRRLAEAERRSIEDAARHARYEYLQMAARRLRASRIATGHTLEDQAETVLLRLMRGAGRRGLAGILPVSENIVRPCLEVSRYELRRYLADRNLAFREDASNADLSLARNRVRHDLLPRLVEGSSDRLVHVLARHAELARADENYLEMEAVKAARQIVTYSDAGAWIDAVGLGALPLALSRRVVRGAISQVAGGRFLGFDHVTAVLDLLERPSAAVDVPGAKVEMDGCVLKVSARRHRHVRQRQQGRAVDLGLPGTSFHYTLSVPGEVVVSEAGCVIAAEVLSGPAVPETTGEGAMLDAAQVGSLVHVRSRRAGDLFRPLGLSGHKKLQDFFVDRKVARQERDRVPLVVREDGQILWVAGHEIGHDFRVTPHTRAVVTLKLKPLGGRA